MSKVDVEGLLRDLREAMPFLLGVTGFKLDYTPESLDELEKVINRMFPEGHQPMPTTCIPFGFYLGETIVRNIPGAKWVAGPENHIHDVMIEIHHGGEARGEVRPFVRVEKFWRDRTDGLGVFFRTIHLMSSGIDPTGMATGDWMEFPNGDHVRMVAVEIKEGESEQEALARVMKERGGNLFSAKNAH